MAVTPANANSNEQHKAWMYILRSMGYRDLKDLIANIYISSGPPDTELSDMDDYCFVWDATNRRAYVHTTGSTSAGFPAVGLALDSDMKNAQTLPNAEG